MEGELHGGTMGAWQKKESADPQHCRSWMLQPYDVEDFSMPKSLLT